MADDRGVDEDVERFGGEDEERRQRQGRDAAPTDPRGRRRAAGYQRRSSDCCSASFALANRWDVVRVGVGVGCCA
jgi:hypothetical protein